MTKTILFAAGLALVSTAAAAQDYDWRGAHVGLGLATGSTEVSMEAPDTDERLDNRTVSAFANYSFQAGRIVFGPELEYAVSSIQGDLVDDPETSATRVKARIGFDGGRVMPYVFGGLSYMKIDDDTSGFSESGPLYAAGAGIDMAVGDHFTVGVQYLEEWSHDGTDIDFGLSNETIGLRVGYAF